MMRELDLSDPNAIDAALGVLRHDVVMLQMPTVYVLMAPPTAEGARRLDRAKTRQANKNYGTVLGDVANLHAMAAPHSLPPELDSAAAFERFTGAFIRLQVAERGFNSTAVRGGTHQGLLVDGPHRELFRAIEADCAGIAEPALFGGHRFGAPLCTSANHSGDPDGSITDWERAWEFGNEIGVPLVLRGPSADGELGSYPIFWLRHDRISIERRGPGEAEIQALLPPRLFADGAALVA